MKLTKLLSTYGILFSSCISAFGNPHLRITTSSLPTGTVGQSYSSSLTAQGGLTPYTWSLTTGVLAPLTLSPQGVISGTPLNAGTLSFTVEVKDSRGRTVSRSFDIAITGGGTSPLAITTSSLPSGTEGVAYSAGLNATGGTPPYKWKQSAGSLPPGIALSGSSLTGTPASTGTYSASFQVQDSSATPQTAGSAMMNITVNAPSPSPLTITTTILPSGTVGSSYSAAVAASGGTTPYTWSATGLPPGVNLNSSTGALSGSPTTSGSYSPSFQLKDSSSPALTATSSIGISVAAAPPAQLKVTTASLPAGAQGSPYSATLTASGGTSPYTWTVATGSLPPGVTLSSAGALSGTPTSPGTFAASFQVKDSAASPQTASSSSMNMVIATESSCTLYASASGNDSNSGTSASSPKTFQGAANATQPGSIVCLLAGTYNLSSSFVPPTNGNASAWIVYKAYGNGAVNFDYSGPADASPMFRVNGSYLEFNGFNLNGGGNALDGFYCNGYHHQRFIGNSISNTGGAGIATVNCDYLTADHNLISHNGYMPASTSVPQYYSWTSGISFNSNYWFDTYSGLHNIVSNNIVAGEYDSSGNNTDGNGIIMDLGGNTPPVLILNNVVYGNGGRCIQPNYVQNFWVINNTCYKNDLDSAEPDFPEFGSNGASNGYMINNIAYSWNSGYPAYGEYNSSSNIWYYADMMYGASYNFSYSDSSQFISADPLFVNPPSLSQGGYSTALPASQLGTGLELQSGSPAIGRGIDPTTVSGIPSAILNDLKAHIYSDMNGNSRPQGGPFDLGAYQH